MKIATKLKIHIVFLINAILVLGLVDYRYYMEVEEVDKKYNLIGQLVSRSFELNLLTYDFLSEPSERSRTQWILKYGTMSTFMKKLKGEGKEGLLIENLHRNHGDMMKVFPLLMDQMDSRETTLRGQNWRDEFKNRLSLQLLLKSQNMISNANRLKSYYENQNRTIRNIFNVLVAATIVLFLVIGVYFMAFVFKAVLQPIMNLYKDAEIIGKGNLTHQIPVSSQDEIGGLAEIMNKMTRNLAKITVSRDELVREVELRKKAEHKIQTSLNEKEILLQEIHHRVKNNMAVIASLLQLQSNNVQDNQIKAVLKESRNRVYAMSVVHEILYRAENLAEIDLKTYLTKISGALTQAYSANLSKTRLTIRSDPIKIGIEKASPLGLVVNELVSNSLKYAFPDDREGELILQVSKHDNHIELIVMDNGIGIPEEFDWKETPTLGLKLVRALIENQLNGSIELDRQEATKFIIKFDQEEA